MSPAEPPQTTAERARELLVDSFSRDPGPISAADLAMQARRQGAAGAWTLEEWAAYLSLKDVVSGSLRRWIGARGKPGIWLYDATGRMLVSVTLILCRFYAPWRRSGRPRPRTTRGPDRMRIVLDGLPIPGNAGTTYGNVVHLCPDPGPSERKRALLNHEYVHVLQTRRDGALFLVRYLWSSWSARRRGEHHYWGNPYEVQAYAVEQRITAAPWLPDVWDLPPADDRQPSA